MSSRTPTRDISSAIISVSSRAVFFGFVIPVTFCLRAWMRDWRFHELNLRAWSGPAAVDRCDGAAALRRGVFILGHEKPGGPGEVYRQTRHRRATQRGHPQFSLARSPADEIARSRRTSPIWP